MKSKKPTYFVRPRTAVLTRGFDPRLSLAAISREWKQAQTLVAPDRDAPACRELLESYLVPFNDERGLG